MCFGAGKTKTTTKTELPEWLEEAAQFNIGVGQDIAARPYQAYDQPRIAPFTPDQTQAFDMIRDYGSQFAGPTGRPEQIAAASTAPIMQYGNLTSLDAIPNAAGVEGTVQDYMNPYIQNVLQDTLGEMNRQAGTARQGINRQSTMAGAFGDAGHGVQRAELERNLLDLTGQASNRAYSDAYTSAQGLRQADMNRLLDTFRTNLGSYEGGLQRAIGGAGAESAVEGADLSNFLNYAGAINAAGAQQQSLGQQSADLGYADFLRQQNYPVEMLNMLNQTTSMQPHGQTRTQTQPAPSPFSQILGGAASIGSFFI